MFGGISSNGAVTNSYNLGDININMRINRSLIVGGITNYAPVTNSVNAGNITVKTGQPSSPTSSMYIIGIADGTTTNCFNSGTITALDSNSNPLSIDYLNDPDNYFYLGEINPYYYDGIRSTGNKFNTSPDKYAIGRVPTEYTPEQAELIGTYTTEEVPDILSIINAGEEDGGAFEILEGETLPTLKAFNN